MAHNNSDSYDGILTLPGSAQLSAKAAGGSEYGFGTSEASNQGPGLSPAQAPKARVTGGAPGRYPDDWAG